MPTPGAGEVLVKVRLVFGQHRRYRPGAGLPSSYAARIWTEGAPERAVGADMVGEVVEVGPDVDRFRAGEVVWADLFEAGHSAFSEYVCVRRPLARSLAGFFRSGTVGALTNRRAQSRITNFSWKANSGDDLAQIGRLVEQGAVTPRTDGIHPLSDLPRALARHAATKHAGKS